MKRDYYFDNLKFLLIFLVVLGHALEPVLNQNLYRTLYFWIYSFHMPLFIFVTGYFSKNINIENYGRKLFDTLLVPYLIFETLYSIFDYFVHEKEKIEFTFFNPYWITWFLLSVLLWKMILPYLAKNKMTLFVSIALSVLIGYAADSGYYLSIGRTFVYFPFFIMGYLFQRKYLEWIKKKSTLFASGVFSIAIGIYYFYNNAKYKVQWLYGTHNYEHLEFDVWYAGVYRFLLIVIAILISVFIMAVIPNKNIPIVTQIGTRTITIYLIHGFLIEYLNSIDYFLRFTEGNNKWQLILLIVVIVVVLGSGLVSKLFTPIIYPTKYVRKKQTRKTSSQQTTSI